MRLRLRGRRKKNCKRLVQGIIHSSFFLPLRVCAALALRVEQAFNVAMAEPSSGGAVLQFEQLQVGKRRREANLSASSTLAELMPSIFFFVHSLSLALSPTRLSFQSERRLPRVLGSSGRGQAR